MDSHAPDPLTGLPQGIRTMPADARFGAVIWIDIDKLKPLNDQYGHQLGDVIISVVADVIATASPYFTCRAGGDEFLITIPVVDGALGPHTADAVQDAVASVDHVPSHVADRIRALSAQMFRDLDGREYRISIGEWLDQIQAEQPGLVDTAIRSTTVSVGVATAAATGDESFGPLEGAAWAALARTRRKRGGFRE